MGGKGSGSNPASWCNGAGNPAAGIGVRLNGLTQQAAPLSESMSKRKRGPREAQQPGISGRRPKLVTLGISQTVIEQSHPLYKQALVNANKYMLLRQKELFQQFGYVSAGVNSMLSSAALSLAASRYIYERAAQLNDLDAKLITLGAKLGAEARLGEHGAYEMCKQESKAFGKLREEQLPWNNAASVEEELAESKAEIGSEFSGETFATEFAGSEQEKES